MRIRQLCGDQKSKIWIVIQLFFLEFNQSFMSLGYDFLGKNL